MNRQFAFRRLMICDGRKITCHTTLKGESHHKCANICRDITWRQRGQYWRGLQRDLPLWE